MNDSKLLKIYLDTIGAKVRFCSGGLHVISTPEDDYYYSTFEEMISDIKYTISQWKLEQII